MDLPYFFSGRADELGHYLVEAHVDGDGGPAGAVERVRAAAARVTAEGVPVRYLESFHAPSEAVGFHLFAGRSAAAVTRVAELAELRVERLVEAVT